MLALRSIACFTLLFFGLLCIWGLMIERTSSTNPEWKGKAQNLKSMLGVKPKALVPMKPATPQGRNLRVLFFTNYVHTYNVFMDRFFVHQYLAMKNHQRVEAVFWGIGFAGYDDSRTIRENLVRRFGSVYFDIFYLFGGIPNHELAAISTETAVMIREHECWDRRCVPFIHWNNVSLMLFSYAQEMFDYADLSARRVLAHSPHAAYVPYFFKQDVATEDPDSRSISVLLAGAKTPTVYPLRERFRHMLPRINNSLIYPHPGYEVQADGAPEPDDPSFPDAHPLEQQMKSYATMLHKSRICVMDSSIYGYALQKYAQAALGGCLIIGDIPHERSQQWRDFVVEVNINDSDDTIISTINWWLEHDVARLRRVRRGQDWVLNHATWETWANEVIETFNLWRKGKYGLHFPHPFDITCTPTNHLKDQYNRWC